MPITLACTCGKSYPVKDEFAGLQVACPDCGALLTIPLPPGASPPRRVAPPAKATTPPPTTRPARSRARRSSGRNLLVPLLVLAAMLLVLGALAVGLIVLVPMIFRDGKADESRADSSTTEASGTPISVEKPPTSTAPWKGHTAPIRAVSFSVDGRFAISGSGGYAERAGKKTPLVDNSIRYWDAVTGKEHRLLSGFPEGITALAFSPDGHFAVVGCAGRVRDGIWSYGPEFEVHLYDLQAERAVRSFAGSSGEIHCVAISADGRRIVSGGADNSVRVWDAESGKQLHILLGHTKTIYSVCLSSNGKLALSAGGDGTIRLWDLDDGIEVQKYTGHQDIVWSVAFSPDGKQAASAGGRQYTAEGGFVPGARDFVVRLWDVAGGEKIREFRGHTDWIGALAFSHDGKRLLSAGADAVRLWQIASGQELTHFGTAGSFARAAAFAPDDSRALTGGDDATLSVWDLPLGVAELVRDLGGDDVRRRLEAAQALGRLGAEARPAVPILLQTLTDKNEELRKEALASLQRIGPPEAKDVRLLVPVLRDAGFAAGQRYALESLSKLGASAEPAVAALADTLKDPSDEVRIKSAELLGTIGPPARAAAWDALVALLSDADATVRATAAAALPKLGSPGRGEVGTLTKLLTDSREASRRYALTALADIGADAADAVPTLLDAATKDASSELRVLAVIALVKIQPNKKEVIAAFARALADDTGAVAEQAARALAAVGPKNGALPDLLQALEHRNAAVVRIAADALKTAPLDKTQVPLLEKALQSKSAVVRQRAIETLGRLGKDASHAVSPLCDLLKDSSVEERRAIVLTLGKIGPAARDAGPRLVDYLKDNDAAVSRETALTLGRIEAAEVEQAVPLLVHALRITKPDDASQVADRASARQMLLRIGKPAAHGLARALENDFSGGRLNSVVGQANAFARLVAVQTLEEMGAKANVPQVLLALAHLQGKDPIPAIRQAAKKARAQIQSAK
jgi:HEAT repeat protein